MTERKMIAYCDTCGERLGEFKEPRETAREHCARYPDHKEFRVEAEK